MTTPSAKLDPAPFGRPTAGYIPALDGIRAIGVALVILCHVARPRWFGGVIGVDMFFVLSGYLITTILLAEYGRTGGINMGRFYLRRIIRLYPSLALAVVVLFVPGLIFAPNLMRYVWDSLIALTYTTPILMELGIKIPQAWGHTWTLGLEALFYLAWPVILLAMLRTRKLHANASLILAGIGSALGVACMVLSLVFQWETWLFQAGGMFIGCALAFYLHRHPTRSVSRQAGWTGLSLVAVAVVLQTGAPWVSGVPALLAWAGTATIIAHLATQKDSSVHRFLAVQPMVYLGKISYELYLWHYPVMLIVGWATGLSPIRLSWLIVPLSFGLAAASHAVLAKCIDRWKQGMS